ncbi:helix-turn-helix domain-containing protein [Actinotalea fermentans]|uniref:Transcriptional regulator n=1 Tax=Actinotalea fermentans TaxID=43671 RepID=A0A511YXH6_9CELL|nr:helix-turn-helix transcriptional regulator [Actinotalea fermentans]GEN79891.1 transcriptional regulator [Actinotalea fermentans]
MLTDGDRARGRALGQALRAARGERSQAEIARAASLSLDTLRKLEQGGTPTPGFFLIALVARELNLALDDLACAVLPTEGRRP